MGTCGDTWQTWGAAVRSWLSPWRSTACLALWPAWLPGSGSSYCWGSSAASGRHMDFIWHVVLYVRPYSRHLQMEWSVSHCWDVVLTPSAGLAGRSLLSSPTSQSSCLAWGEGPWSAVWPPSGWQETSWLLVRRYTKYSCIKENEREIIDHSTNTAVVGV